MIVFFSDCFKPQENYGFGGFEDVLNHGQDDKTETACECFLLCKKSQDCEMFEWLTTSYDEGILL